jgi:hypothetical protein
MLLALFGCVIGLASLWRSRRKRKPKDPIRLNPLAQNCPPA